MSYVVQDFYRRGPVYGPQGSSRLVPGWGHLSTSPGPRRIAVGALGVDPLLATATGAGMSLLQEAGVSTSDAAYAGAAVLGTIQLGTEIYNAVKGAPDVPEKYVSVATVAPVVGLTGPTPCQAAGLLKNIYDFSFQQASSGVEHPDDQLRMNAVVDAINSEHYKLASACQAAGGQPSTANAIPASNAAVCALNQALTNLRGVATAQAATGGIKTVPDQFKLNRLWDIIAVNQTAAAALCKTAAGPKVNINVARAFLKGQALKSKGSGVMSAPTGGFKVDGPKLAIGVGVLALLAGVFYALNREPAAPRSVHAR